MGSSHKLYTSPYALIHKRCFVEMFIHLHHQRYWLQNIHIFFSVAATIWHSYSIIYGFHCTLSSALPICMAEWISRTHLIFQSKQKKKHFRSAEELDTKCFWARIERATFFFFFFACELCGKQLKKLPHSVEHLKKRGKSLRRRFKSWQCLWDSLHRPISSPHLVWMSKT